MHATHTLHLKNHEATESALLGQTLQIVVGGSTYTGVCEDVVRSMEEGRDDLVKVAGCEDYSREWKVIQ